jgi:hypothetical protein
LPFKLLYTAVAEKQIASLRQDASLEKRFKAVKKALRLLSENPAHPGLNTHKYSSLLGPERCEVFEAYAENKTPAAYRIFWCYYPPKTKTDLNGNITILAVTSHP